MKLTSQWGLLLWREENCSFRARNIYLKARLHACFNRLNRKKKNAIKMEKSAEKIYKN
ncbi:hypothetical protein EZS27_028335 [termite gut metagenome]|uniref:Uncharacterized protein n=1 Tax=termite gut metagenome TaxID=433724 RepID=A0A5J4QMA9_9ZZZZ